MVSLKQTGQKDERGHLWALREELVRQAPKDSCCITPLLVSMRAEVE